MTLLRCLNNYIQYGIVEAGPRGELLARVMLLMCRDATVDNEHSDRQGTETVKVGDFLNQLYGHERSGIIRGHFGDNADSFMGGYLSFNHFIYVNVLPPIETMEFYYVLHMALFCRRNQDLVDLIIPVKLAGGQFSFILVQVKNHQRGYGFPPIPSTIAGDLFGTKELVESEWCADVTMAEKTLKIEGDDFNRIADTCKRCVKATVRALEQRSDDVRTLTKMADFVKSKLQEKGKVLRINEDLLDNITKRLCDGFRDLFDKYGNLRPAPSDENKKSKWQVTPSDFKFPYLYLFMQLGRQFDDEGGHWAILGRTKTGNLGREETERPGDASVWVGSFGISNSVYPFMNMFGNAQDNTLLLRLRESWADPCESLQNAHARRQFGGDDDAFKVNIACLESTLVATYGQFKNWNRSGASSSD
jgi:hypothetical protein